MAISRISAQPSGDAPIDLPRLVSRADIVLDRPVSRPEAGMPIGNGRMGSLVWTLPNALRLQINRVDVFGNDRSSNSFPQRYTDYAGGCAFVDIELVSHGEDVFSEKDTRQRLDCYQGILNLDGKGVKTRTFAWHERDVMAIEITDDRPEPQVIRVNLRMLRPGQFRTLGQTAASKLAVRNGRLLLTQAFEEDSFFCGSVVALGVVGRSATLRQTRDDELSLVLAPGQGLFTVLIASAASMNREEPIADSALTQLETAAGTGFAQLFEANKSWWADFWSRGYVRLHSADGVADEIEKHYTYYLYVMASSSRGKYPTKFNGMIWTTGGDARQWGSQYWGANQSCLYNALFPTNRWELLDPVFDTYTAMKESCALAAEQQWGSKGIFFPETYAFNGLAPLPDDIAAEMRDLYLLRRPWEQMTARFRAYAQNRQPHSSRWNWQGSGKWVEGRWEPEGRGGGPYGPVTHIFSRGAKIAYQFWQRYEYTLDQAWLRERAYPIMKGVAEFYRNHPNLKKGSDGKYHLYHVNSNESIWGGRDPDEEISSMRGLLPATIRASEILGVDADMRPVWGELLSNLAPLPTSNHPDAQPAGQGSRPYWIRALPPIVRGNGTSRPDGNTMPIWFFDLCTLENPDPARKALSDATFDGYFPEGVGRPTRVGVLSKLGVTAAMVGRAEYVRYLLPNQIFSQESSAMDNRMDLREGFQTTSVQRLGRAADTLHNALCQSVGAGPAEAPVIRVFPAWPKDWDAAFSLLARGGFTVESAMRNGEIEFVGIQSRMGGECRVRNPWAGPVTIYRQNTVWLQLNGSLLKFETSAGEEFLLRPTDLRKSE